MADFQHDKAERGSVLRLTRKQYRAFAETSKAFGLGLNLSSYEHLGCWGQYSPFALLICNDAANADTTWSERALISLASSINADALRAAGPGRPELDWSVLEDDEIYPFVLWHEIGHSMSNFCRWDVMMLKESDVRARCERHIGFVNEVLADRYAWSRIRPGEPIPKTESGQRLEEKIAEAIDYIGTHVRTMGDFPVRPLQPGQYRDVPEYMLATPQRAAFLGPAVDPVVLDERVKNHKERLAQGCRPSF